MTTGKTFTEIALSFQGAEQRPHFERIGFKVIGKRMFATYLAGDNTANIFLSPREQKVFCKIDPENIAPVPNKWGEKGATTFKLDSVSRDLIWEALNVAYAEIIAPKN